MEGEISYVNVHRHALCIYSIRAFSELNVSNSTDKLYQEVKGEGDQRGSIQPGVS